jgi:hypothetical protein
MHKDHGLSPVEFFENGSKGGIAEPFVAIARQQGDAVGLQRVERILDLAQRAFGVRQGNCGKQAEPAGVFAQEIGTIVVHPPRELICFLCIAEPYPGRRQRQDSGCNAMRIHRIERLLWAPFEPGAADFAAARTRDPVAVLFKIKWRDDMAVDIDQPARRIGTRRANPAACRDAAERGRREASDKLASPHGRQCRRGTAKTATQ